MSKSDRQRAQARKRQWYDEQLKEKAVARLVTGSQPPLLPGYAHIGSATTMTAKGHKTAYGKAHMIIKSGTKKAI
jgi:hypothetical protein